MALIFPSSSSSTIITSNHKYDRHYHLLHLKTAIKASSSQESTEESALPAKSTSTPVGFGSSSISSSSPVKKPKSNNKKERARIIRREPVQTPKFASIKQKEQLGDNVSSQQGVDERAFLLAWLGLGSLIIVEGLALAASGFLPEEWDALFVKYLYPIFTPTVFLFVAGTVVYGLLKYLQNEKTNSSN